MNFLDFLAKKGIVSAEDAQTIAQEGNIDDALIARGMNPADIAQAKAEYFGVPFRTVGDHDISFETLKLIPEESAKYYEFVPVGVKDGVMEVGFVDPDNTQARDALQFISTKLGMPFKVFVVSKEDFEKVIQSYKNLRGEVSKALSELESTGQDREQIVKDIESEAGSAGKEETIAEDAPVTKIVAVILRHATEGAASDVHIERLEEKVRVRFRVDGVLYTSLILPANVHDAIVARIKILANLKLDEKRKPQDGRFSARIEGRKIDFRVSTFPAYYGEKVVMRILDTGKGVRTIDQVGFSAEHLDIVKRALAAPYGIILLTGPTGSGKTTSLYSMLGAINEEGVNVVSLEDPVEYHIEGISQSQVRPEIGYTFASGLRSILRQDPDIIMVGEIRDKETAQLAIQAALTGHLVLSTLHTNNSIGVVPRLVDMGVDPFLIAPTLVLAIAQRLVRTACPGSQEEIPMDPSAREMIARQVADLAPDRRQAILDKAQHMYKINPTAECPSGTRGRTPVFEMLEIDKDIEEVILRNPVEEAISKVARGKGMYTLREDAIVKALDGVIPFEEVYNV